MKKSEIFCDVLTFSRVIVAGLILFAGFYFKANGLRLVIIGLLIGWTTDILDGRIARRINKPETIIGKNDIRFDTLMVSSTVFYLVLAGFFPWYLFILGFLLVVLALWPKVSYNLIQIFKVPTVTITSCYLLYCEGTLLFLFVVLGWSGLMFAYNQQRARQSFSKLKTLFLRGLFKKRRS